jgi:hypothetical protein
MQVGVDSFVAATVDAGGRAVDPAKHLSELLEAITLADEVGLDVFGIGEHHRREFLDSAPTVILAAAAARTRRIRLTSAVTVLSAADPVRWFARRPFSRAAQGRRSFARLCRRQFDDGRRRVFSRLCAKLH